MCSRASGWMLCGKNGKRPVDVGRSLGRGGSEPTDRGDETAGPQEKWQTQLRWDTAFRGSEKGGGGVKSGEKAVYTEQ